MARKGGVKWRKGGGRVFVSWWSGKRKEGGRGVWEDVRVRDGEEEEREGEGRCETRRGEAKFVMSSFVSLFFLFSSSSPSISSPPSLLFLPRSFPILHTFLPFLSMSSFPLFSSFLLIPFLFPPLRPLLLLFPSSFLFQSSSLSSLTQSYSSLLPQLSSLSIFFPSSASSGACKG